MWCSVPSKERQLSPDDSSRAGAGLRRSRPERYGVGLGRNHVSFVGLEPTDSCGFRVTGLKLIPGSSTERVLSAPRVSLMLSWTKESSCIDTAF